MSSAAGSIATRMISLFQPRRRSAELSDAVSSAVFRPDSAALSATAPSNEITVTGLPACSLRVPAQHRRRAAGGFQRRVFVERVRERDALREAFAQAVHAGVRFLQARERDRAVAHGGRDRVGGGVREVELMADEQQVGARGERFDGAAHRADAVRDRVHLQAVGRDDAVVAELAAQQAGQDRAARSSPGAPRRTLRSRRAR